MRANWLGGRLRELREAAGLTQQQVADAVGCSWQAVSRWERDKREPGWSQVIALCAALGVSCEAFQTPPAEREPAGPGRPPKVKAEEPPPGKKKKRGRPKKTNQPSRP
jgi:transcriptional regulator with XRE-family HTH domain